MDELERINAKISKKQMIRFTVGPGLMVLGLVLLGNGIYQKGITYCQEKMSRFYPDLYDEMTERVIKEFERTD
jgi:hypothetical protein